MEWSSQDAIKAYLHTLQLSKKLENETKNTDESETLIEPKSMELIAALAAGKQAKTMVEILAGEEITPFTIALAVAAKQIKSQLICIVLQPDHVDKCKSQLLNATSSCDDHQLMIDHDLIEFVYGNPTEIIPNYFENKSIDFAVVDCKVDCYEVIDAIIGVNRRRCVDVVVHNLDYKRDGGASINGGRRSLRGLVRRFQASPIGVGMELMRIEWRSSQRVRRKVNRFHVIYEN